MGKKSHSPNDQRSIVKNPTSQAYASDRGNRLNQGHAAPPATAVVAPSGKPSGAAK